MRRTVRAFGVFAPLDGDKRVYRRGPPRENADEVEHDAAEMDPYTPRGPVDLFFVPVRETPAQVVLGDVSVFCIESGHQGAKHPAAAQEESAGNQAGHDLEGAKSPRLDGVANAPRNATSPP